MPSIPDRWIPYKACGNIIEGTRLICFKVPLNKNVQKFNKEIKEIWDIPALIEKIPKLGAVIDLTNTARYYNPAELKAAGVLHKKILMPGRIIPPENKVTEFMDTVDEFLGKDCESPSRFVDHRFMDTVDEFLGKDCVAMQVQRARLGLSTTEMVIGVHCTHGLNRTGYMVCRYMRDRLGVPAKDAIKRFEKARGYQIERENYIADLLNIAPRPPDLGKETVIKPMAGKYLPNKRSPLAQDEDEYVTKSINRDRYYRNNSRNWRHRPNSESSGTSFDYKYDY